MKIEHFKRHQFDSLLAVGRMMHEESSYSHLAFSPEKLKALGSATIAEPQRYLGLAAMDDSKICGLFIGIITPYFFSEEKIASDLVLFVVQDSRGGMAAMKLVRAYESWAVSNGAKQIMLGVSTGVNEKRTLALYDRLGYKPAGGIVKKNV